METSKIALTFEQPVALIKAFSDDLEYQEKIRNPKFEETVNQETLEVSNNGEEPFIDNPQTREEYLAEEAIDLITDWQMSFAKRNAIRTSTEQVNTAISQQKEQLKKAFKVTID